MFKAWHKNLVLHFFRFKILSSLAHIWYFNEQKHFSTCIVHSTNFLVISVNCTADLTYHLLIDLENGFFQIEFCIKLPYNTWQVFNTTIKNYMCTVIVMLTCIFWPNDLHFDSTAPSEPDCEASACTCQPDTAHWHTKWTCSVSFLYWSPCHKIMKFIANCYSFLM